MGGETRMGKSSWEWVKESVREAIWDRQLKGNLRNNMET